MPKQYIDTLRYHHRNNQGVYEFLNTLTGKRYIGSTAVLTERSDGHWSQLECGKHRNKDLQLDFDKYGHEHFVFGVLEYVHEVWLLKDCEQKYIDKYGLENLYNIQNAVSKKVQQIKKPIDNESKASLTRRKKWDKNKDENERQLRIKFEQPIIWEHLKVIVQFSLDDKVIAIHKDSSKQVHEICRHYSKYKKRLTPKKFKGSRWAYLDFVVMCNVCKCKQPLEIYSDVFLCTSCGHSDTYTINALHNLEKYRLTCP